MRIAHVSPSDGQECGIALLATALARELGNAGCPGTVHRRLPSGHDRPDLVVIHHHPELLDVRGLVDVRSKVGRDVPIVLFVHEPVGRAETQHVDGTLALCHGMVPPGVLNAVVPHPAVVASRPQSRESARRQLGLPVDRLILGSSGFLRFERQFDEVIRRLLPAVARHDWLVYLCVSPWHTPSPGLLARLREMESANPHLLRIEHGHLNEVALIDRLRACDLLWCWTRAASRAYGSGVVSTQYASGTRMVVTSKRQHEFVLGLRNVVAGPDQVDAFADAVCAEAASGCRTRHNPRPVAWEAIVPTVLRHLRAVERAQARFDGQV